MVAEKSTNLFDTQKMRYLIIYGQFFFSLVHSKLDIFLTSMKFSLNHHKQNFLYAIFKKMTVKYLFN